MNVLCPQRNGNVIFQARALYAQVFNDMSMFNDDSCLSADSTYFSARHSAPSTSQKVNSEQQYRLYPNPNDGSFVLQQYNQDNEPVKVKIFDALGRVIYSVEIQFNNTKSQLIL